MPNRLATEHSPYLLQHQDNPVDWYPWGDEAFARARAEDKPIFLSIGYSTCHWCHVMEHESFEHPDVAELLRREFISIKVDREERPDVDRVYMTFVQATTGSGGWPMSVWLTPSLQPFYGGTYYPPTSKWNRPGFIEVLTEIARVWRDERENVQRSAGTIVERLRALRPYGEPSPVPGTDVLDAATAEFTKTFDQERGGFGNAPKFPRPSELLFLLREHARTGADGPRDMALLTLRAMALAGMRDHLGGGFHRYSVDGEWRVPHFEKMLYDQAQLVLAYAEAAQITGDGLYAAVAIDTLEYVKRDLADPGGGFYSAEDADSTPPDAPLDGPHAGRKMEGAFYIWSDAEIGDALGADADVFRARFGILPGGNAPFNPQNEFTAKNLLYTAQPLHAVATTSGRSVDDVAGALERARTALLGKRAGRPRPQLDDKVLTAWNGLMIAAFARTARVVRGAERYLDDARRAAEFIRARLWDPRSGSLLRRYRAGHAGVEAYAEDYAYLIFGLLELFQADGDPQWLEWALTLQRRQDQLFWDADDGGWFSTTGHDPSVLIRLKEDHDGAEPAASSVAVLNLLTLSHLTGDRRENAGESDAKKIERTLRGFGARATQFGRAVPMMLAALSTYHAGVGQVVVVGEAGAAETRALVDVLRERYRPSTLQVIASPRHRAALTALLPWIGPMTDRDGQVTAYVCRAFTCQAPTTSPDELRLQLGVSPTS